MKTTRRTLTVTAAATATAAAERAEAEAAQAFAAALLVQSRIARRVLNGETIPVAELDACDTAVRTTDAALATARANVAIAKGDEVLAMLRAA